MISSSVPKYIIRSIYLVFAMLVVEIKEQCHGHVPRRPARNGMEILAKANADETLLETLNMYRQDNIQESMSEPRRVRT